MSGVSVVKRVEDTGMAPLITKTAEIETSAVDKALDCYYYPLQEWIVKKQIDPNQLIYGQYEDVVRLLFYEFNSVHDDIREIVSSKYGWGIRVTRNRQNRSPILKLGFVKDETHVLVPELWDSYIEYFIEKLSNEPEHFFLLRRPSDLGSYENEEWYPAWNAAITATFMDEDGDEHEVPTCDDKELEELLTRFLAAFNSGHPEGGTTGTMDADLRRLVFRMFFYSLCECETAQHAGKGAAR